MKRTFAFFVTGVFLLLATMVFAGGQSETSTASAPEVVDETIVTVTGGTIQGYIDGNSVKTFKGIPFAATTSGGNRWKAPQPVVFWEGIKECKEYSPITMQSEDTTYGGAAPWTTEFKDLGKTYENGQISEDNSLSLNVWTTAKSGDKKPVIVFIHGGGNNHGSGTIENYTGMDISQKGVVYVTVNYRVGIFGFLAYKDSTGEELTGNYAIMDLIAALKWVQENIAKFGGDPSNVTIAGQSAGSMNVQTLIASPAAKGLFTKAVAMSGNSLAMPTPTKEMMQQAASKSIGEYTIADLRAMKSDEIQAMTRKFNPSNACIDGTIVTQGIGDAYRSGNYNKVDLIEGSVTEDAGLFVAMPLPDDDHNPYTAVTTLTPANYEKAAGDAFGPDAGVLLALYPAPAGVENVIETADKVNFDSMVAGYYFAAKLKDAGDRNHDTYIYNFSHVLPDTPQRMATHGAFHTGDVPYWVNHFSESYPRAWTEADYYIGDSMSGYLVNFAYSRDPNGEGLVEWPLNRDSMGLSYLNLDDTIGLIKMDKAKADFWEKFYKSLYKM